MHDRGIWDGLASARYVMDVQAKRVAYAMRKKSRAYTRCEYCTFLGLGPEYAEFLEAMYQNAVAKQLHRVPVQFRLERLEGGLVEVRVSCEREPPRSRTYRLHLKDDLVDCAGLRGKFTPVTHGHCPCNYKV
jgi:hypothetical protein